MNKHTALVIVISTLPLGLFTSGCNSISPILHDEYIRPGLSQGIRSVFDQYRQRLPKKMIEEKVPGLSFALVDREGILWAGGFGYTDYDRKTPVTTETTFAVCSVSKTITAAAVMVAVQDGLVGLDVPIIEYWPQFKVNSRFEENPEQNITLRHLLTHTSGIAFDAPVGNAREPSFGSLEEHVRSVSDTWLRHKVGERYRYSSLGYDLVAYILQIQSGETFAEYVEEKLLTPLNMSNCSVELEFIRNHGSRAIGHMPFTKQIPLPIDIPVAGAGSVYADVKGMAKFVQLFLNEGNVDGRQVLVGNSITDMYTPSIRKEDYGLGVQYFPGEFYALGHDGGGFGFGAIMYWLPEYEIGAVFLFNLDRYGWASGCINLLLDLVNKRLIQKKTSFEIPSSEYQAEQPLNPNTFTPFKPEWQKYIGTYEFAMSGWKFNTLFRIARALGVKNEYLHAKVLEKDGYLYIDKFMMHENDGGRLNEHLPGVFFTPSGKCLDLCGPKFTFQNYRMKKTK